MASNWLVLIKKQFHVTSGMNRWPKAIEQKMVLEGCILTPDI
jgi:hypothetical protein